MTLNVGALVPRGVVGAEPARAVVWETALAACGEDKACAIGAGGAAGADLVLILAGRHGDQSFEVRAEIWDGAAGRLISESSKDCGLCTLGELYEAAEDQAASLVARAKRGAGGGEGSAGESTAEPGGGGASSEARAADRARKRTWLQWGRATAGLAALAGSILWILDGDDVECQDDPGGNVCTHERKTLGSPWLGPTLTIGGLLGAGAATFFLLGGTF